MLLAHNFVGRYGWRDKSDLIGTVESRLTKGINVKLLILILLAFFQLENVAL